jgi:hypothetical protein
MQFDKNQVNFIKTIQGNSDGILDDGEALIKSTV